MFLRDRRFRVHMADKTSSWRIQKNGLPQGSVLSPCLFNIYINDLPSTCSRKFIYADDICLAAQGHTFGEVEEILNRDLEKMATFFGRWRIQPSSSKTVCCVFHLHNARANQKLNLLLSGQQIRHEPNPVYLGVTMDRSLTFRSHLKKSAAKLGTRNNLLSKLAIFMGHTGFNTQNITTSDLLLCNSVAEYCAPVWSRSSHINLIDSQLNETMRIITGTLWQTPLPWLPVMSHIAPPHLRRQEAPTKLLTKIELNDSLLLHKDITSHPVSRLPSRRPIWQEWSKIFRLVSSGSMNGYLQTL